MSTSQVSGFDPEECRLLVLEEVITRGERTFIDVGQALMEIRDKGLYRKNSQTFEEYVKTRWFKTSRWAFNMINSAVVVQELPHNLRTVVHNERTARELSCVPPEIREAVIEHIRDAHKPINSVTVKEAVKPEKSLENEDNPQIQTADLELHQPAERAQMPKPAIGIIGWSVKLMELFEKLPKDELAPKLDWQHRKIVENSIDLLRSTLSVFIPKTSVVEPCKCGCGLTVGVCEALFRIGVPSVGLTQNQAGLLISKAKVNNYKLPEAFAFARNEGEWVERKFKGTKPAKKEA